MESDEVSAHVRDRLGMEVQAVSLVRARALSTPRVWAVMTEHGYFWLVEAAGVVELFRVVSGRAAPASGTSCATAAAAVRRYLELHPAAPEEGDEPAVAASTQTGNLSFACQTCGTWVTRRRRSDSTDRQLCKRCRHAERERLRYHDDPQYRARRLAYSASRYRGHGQSGDPAVHAAGRALNTEG